MDSQNTNPLSPTLSINSHVYARTRRPLERWLEGSCARGEWRKTTPPEYSVNRFSRRFWIGGGSADPDLYRYCNGFRVFFLSYLCLPRHQSLSCFYLLGVNNRVKRG